MAAVRKNLGLGLAEVAERANVKAQFLQNLEESNLAKLPADVYVIGFLKNIAAVYAIDPEVLIVQYKKERGIQDQLQKKPASALGKRKFFSSTLVLTPKNLSICLGIAFVVITLLYVIWQVLSINKAPGLTITQPTDRQVIQQSSIVIKGTTDPGSNLTINQEPVFVDDQGNFSTQMSVEPGLQQLTFVSKNKFNKAVVKQISVIAQASSTVSQYNFNLTLNFLDTASVTISTDDAPQTTYTFHTGDSKTFNAADNIVVSTSNAGATQVTLNKENLGVMGKPGESLTNVLFSADTDSMVPATTTPTQ